MPDRGATLGDGWELDFDADSFSIAKAGCPCPVEWCNAHVLRYAECGDADGEFFGGVHVGRVQRFAVGRWRGATTRALTRVLGEPPSDGVVALTQMIEDGQNLGLVPGTTAAQRRQARARRKLALQ